MPFIVGEVRQIRALASPVRVAIIDALEAGGPLTIADLGSCLGYPPDGLYYHLRALERFGLVTRVDQDAVNGAARFDVPGRPVTLLYKLADARRRTATAKLVSTILRRAERSFRRAYAPGHARADGPHRNLRAGRRTAWLKPAELAALNRALESIHTLFERGRPDRTGARLIELTYVVAPIEPKTRHQRRRSPERQSP
jgi:DNA-binding transcriptional ArsR family regulator